MKGIPMPSRSVTILLAASLVCATCDQGQSPAATPPTVHVPDDFPTIQEALDRSTAAVVVVREGTYDGAHVRRPVLLSCPKWCVIRQGVRRGPTTAGFLLESSASGTTISGFTFAGPDEGVVSSVHTGTAAADVTVTGNTFVHPAQAIVNSGGPALLQGDRFVCPRKGGRGWVITDNLILDLETRAADGTSGGGLGVFLFNADAAVVEGNRILGRVDDAPFTTAGILLTGSEGTIVRGNVVAVQSGGPYHFAVASLGPHQPGGAPSRGTVVEENRSFCVGSWHGYSYIDIDNFDSTFSENRGRARVDHRDPPYGDGAQYEVAGTEETVRPLRNVGAEACLPRIPEPRPIP